MFTGQTSRGPKQITKSQGEGRLGQAVQREEATPGATHAGGRKEPRVDTERPLDRGIPGALQPKTLLCSSVHGGQPCHRCSWPNSEIKRPSFCSLKV